MKPADSDNDGIPDRIEKILKTDPSNPDSDLDGQSDYYELVIEPKLEAQKKPKGTSYNYLEGIAYAGDAIQTTVSFVQETASKSKTIDWDEITKSPMDSDGDGIHNAIDPTHGAQYEGMQDQDGDQIPDVYETYGYSWDYSKNAPAPWGFRFLSSTSIELKTPDEPDYSVRYFKTNLHNAFSDWDAYDDYHEASLNNIEATVLPPTNHPGVASIPNFNVVIDSATVTVTADQIMFPSHSVLKGYKNKQYFVRVEDNPVAKFVINLGAQEASKAAKAYSEGIINVDSKTIGSVTAKGIDLAIGPQYKEVADYETVVDVTDWLNASVDSAHKNNAATINLKWRLVNNGNDAAYDVQPTFNVMLGSNVINTYTPDTKIASVGPHATSAPFFTSDINVSFEQLKAYMTGSLVNTSINQVSANVMTRHKIDESPSKEDWSYFTDNMRTNSATVTVDTGDGKLGTFKMLAVHPLGPSITLRDALIWAIARYDDKGKNTSTAVGEYFGNSSSSIPDFNDWTFYFTGGVDPLDPTTSKDIAPDLDNILDTVILPGSTVYAKAPNAESPVISWARMSPIYNTAAEAAEITNMHQKKIDALIHDYYGVKEVWFGPTPDATDDQKTEMTDDDGDGIYSLILPQEYEPTRQETIFASREQLLTSNPTGEPVVTTATVSYTAPVGRVYSSIKAGLTLPKKGEDYGDIAFFDLGNNKNYNKRGKLSALDAMNFAFGNNSDISIDLNFIGVNEARYENYTNPLKYPALAWYLTSSRAPNSNISFWPADSISYEKLSYADISTASASQLSTSKSASKDKSKLQFSYTQKKYVNGSSFSFMTNSGQWVKFNVGYPYDLHSYKWSKFDHSETWGINEVVFYDYYWRYHPRSVMINYTIYDKQP